MEVGPRYVRRRRASLSNENTAYNKHPVSFESKQIMQETDLLHQ